MTRDRTDITLQHDALAENQFAQYASPLVEAAIAHAHELDAATTADAETLHQLRVSIRRLRSLLWAYRPLLDKKLDDRHRALLAFLANAAGKTRDWDIAIQLVAKRGSPGQDSLAHDLTAARAAASDRSRETLSRANLKSILHDTLKEANQALNTADHRTRLKTFARGRVATAERSLRKRIRHASRAKRSDYAAFHEVRKAGKKLRYLLDFFAPLLSDKQLKPARRLKRLQKRFGALNDIVASESLLRGNQTAFSSADMDAALAHLKKRRKKRLRKAARLL